jgi:hypothetical protein
MSSIVSGRRSPLSIATRAGLFGLSLVLPLALGACTTVEGTNAMTDVGTFEREVMTSTLAGIGMLDRTEKDEGELDDRRGPLVMPRDTASLPAPQPDTTALLPEDSDSVRIDTASLTEEDMKRLRNARVVDLRSLSGRPLTEAETKALTARMLAANKDVITTNGQRPLYLPPEEYFTTVGGVDLICLAADGALVALNDDRCPKEIQDAMRKAPTGAATLSEGST